MGLLHVVGIAGVLLYLLAYALLQLGLLRGSGYTYTLMNMAAAACVLVSLAAEFNLSSFLIQVSWLAISIVGLARMALHRHTLQFTATELEMARRALPGLPKADLRQLMDQGRWRRHCAGTVLTRQGFAVDDLIYVSRGSAKVLRDGAVVATLHEGAFIGEMTCLTGEPATATVVATGDMHCLRLPAATLRQYLARRPQTLEHLERAFLADLRRKLAASASKVAGLSAAAA